MENKEIVLSVKDLRVNFSTDHGYVQAVRGVSFDLYKGETLCIVGESGSGKSVTSKTIMGILAANGRIVNGSIMYEGEDLTKVSEDEFHRIRGHKIGMIFQDPLSSLNPIMRIGKQITEAMLLNGNHLKKMRDDIVANEFVAYKNAITAYNSELNKGKEAVKFFKSEKKKEIARLKLSFKNESTGKIYFLKEEYGLQRVNINHKYDELVKEAKANGDSAKVNEINAKRAEELKQANEKYIAGKNEIKAAVAANKDSNKAQLNAIKADFDKKIKEAKNSRVASKEELKAKYKPLIAETRAKYLAKKKEADIQVNEAKKRFLEEYVQESNDFATKRAAIEEKYAPIFNGIRDKYEPLVADKIAEVNAAKQISDTKQKKEAVAKARKALTDIQIEYSQVMVKAKKEYRAEIAPVSAKAAKRNYISKIKITKAEAKEKALKIMAEVGIPFPERRFRQYPFEFSGGMRQRIVIAIALTADPDILICDEPTTALDVTIQAQILELINRLKAERHMTCIFITHDLGVVANMADRVAVMYAGKIVEYGTEEEIFYDPKHPYTWALLSSIPDIDSKERLDAIPGTPPNLVYPPKGDAFALRSKYAMKIDFKKEPPLFKVSETHYAATWLLDPRAPKVEMPAIVKTRIEASLAANKARAKAKGKKEDDKEDISNAVNPLETGEVAKTSTELEMEQHEEEAMKEARAFVEKKKAGAKKKGGKK